MKRNIILIAIIVITSMCKPLIKNTISNEERVENINILSNNFDTLQVIKQLNLIEKAENYANLYDNINYLSKNVDTLILTYHFAFCDCQRWINTNIYQKAAGENSEIDKIDPRGQVEFNLDKHGYYIEAGATDIKIDWRYAVNGTRVKFTGREYDNKRLPEDGTFTVRNPPKGKVFRYYSYEVLKPYKIWGPPILEEITEDGDSITSATLLNVK